MRGGAGRCSAASGCTTIAIYTTTSPLSRSTIRSTQLQLSLLREPRRLCRGQGAVEQHVPEQARAPGAPGQRPDRSAPSSSSLPTTPSLRNPTSGASACGGCWARMPFQRTTRECGATTAHVHLPQRLSQSTPHAVTQLLRVARAGLTGNVFLSSDAVQTWYDAVYLQAQRGTARRRTGVRTHVHVGKGRSDRGGFVQFRLSFPTDYPHCRRPGVQRNTIIGNWIVDVPLGVQFSGLLNLGSGTPFSKGAPQDRVFHRNRISSSDTLSRFVIST